MPAFFHFIIFVDGHEHCAFVDLSGRVDAWVATLVLQLVKADMIQDSGLVDLWIIHCPDQDSVVVEAVVFLLDVPLVKGHT